jgi:hypothetical protein
MIFRSKKAALCIASMCLVYSGVIHLLNTQIIRMAEIIKESNPNKNPTFESSEALSYIFISNFVILISSIVAFVIFALLVVKWRSS